MAGLSVAVSFEVMRAEDAELDAARGYRHHLLTWVSDFATVLLQIMLAPTTPKKTKAFSCT